MTSPQGGMSFKIKFCTSWRSYWHESHITGWYILDYKVRLKSWNCNFL